MWELITKLNSPAKLMTEVTYLYYIHFPKIAIKNSPASAVENYKHPGRFL
jgi:hypothetical protein